MTPKELLHRNKTKVSELNTLLSSGAIEEFLQVAFNELSWNLPLSEDVGKAWAANARRQGAKDLIQTFLNLGSQQQIRKPTIAGNLENEDHHNVNDSSRSSTGSRSSGASSKSKPGAK